jgi:hypothetical protein
MLLPKPVGPSWGPNFRPRVHGIAMEAIRRKNGIKIKYNKACEYVTGLHNLLSHKNGTHPRNFQKSVCYFGLPLFSISIIPDNLELCREQKDAIAHPSGY